jgi:YegS/Rv2252/BmrU family lipid kinase
VVSQSHFLDIFAPLFTIHRGSMETIAIVNPVAGRAHGARMREQALPELRRLVPGLKVVESSAPGHATELARQHAGAGLVVAVGGDGTVREVAAGLVGNSAELAVVPAGSGNDFNKTVGIPRDVLEACQVAANGAARPVDLARLTASGEGEPRSWVYANAAGFGFDALVIAEARKSTRLRGMPLYLSAVFRAVRNYDCPPVEITVNDRTWRQNVLLLAAANGHCYGGGMRIAPEAKPNDGLLEICVIEAVGRLKVMRYLPKLVKGTHVSLDEVTMLRAPSLELAFDDPVLLQLDGDLVDASRYCRFRIESLPAALRIRTR